MKSVSEFNGLNGKTITRNDVENLIVLAQKEEQTDIVTRLSTLLKEYPNCTRFDAEIDTPVTEQLPNSFLTGLEYIYEENETVGLGKAVSASEIYDMITNKMLDLINAANKGDYKRAWKETGYTIPYNFVSKKGYRGVNAFMLAPFFEILDNPFYLTFKQVNELGGKVRKGAKGHEVVYYSTFDKKYTDAEIERINAVVENIDGTKSVEKGDSKTNFILKYYNVFNGADIEGIDFDLDNFKLAGKVITNSDIDGKDNKKIELAEAIVANYPKPQPNIIFQGSSAFFSPSKDSITVPKITEFDTSQSFYRTLLHELSHSTGHETRLKRDFSGKFGSKEYAFEELIAEFGAVFLSAQAGIMFYTNKNHAGYLKGWNEVLVPQLENDNKFLMKATSQAQKLADFVLQPDANGNFLFMKNDKKTTEKVVAKKPIVKKVIVKKAIAPKKEIPKNKFGKDELVKVIIGNHKNHIGKIIHCNLDQENTIFYYTLENLKEAIAEGNLAVAKVLKTVVKKDVEKKEPLNKIIGYALLDSISGEVVGSKKTLPELKVVWENLNENEIGKGTEIFVYEIVSKLGKNVQGKRVKVIWIKEKLRGLNGTYDGVSFKEKPLLSPTLNFYKDTKIGLGLTIAEKRQQPQALREYYKIDNRDISTFLGKIEKKNKESVVITLAGGQGSGKTRMLFQLMNAFAQNYKCGHASIEEHPESALYNDKVDKYLNSKAQQNTTAPEIENIADLENLILENEIIFIDSFAKLQEIDNRLEVDKDLRKKYDGKLFVIIFQQTTDGKMRGGSKSQFDGDIILLTQPFANYQDNYIYPNKNRYNSIPLDELKLNIYSGKLIKKEAEKVPIENAFTFNIN